MPVGVVYLAATAALGVGMPLRRARAPADRSSSREPPRPVTPTVPVTAETLANLSTKPGVYLFRDARGGVLYVGQGQVAALARAQLLPARGRPDGQDP